MIRGGAVALVLMLAGCQSPAPTRGVWVEKVPTGMVAATAGLRAGDIVISSDRRPIANPFDLLETEMTDAPRAPVTLTVQRGDVQTKVMIPIGEWKLTLKSVLSPELEALEPDKRVAALVAAGRQADACWTLTLRAAELTKAKKSDEADRAFEQALALARGLGDGIIEGHVLNALAEDLDTRSENGRAVKAFADAAEVRGKLAPDGLAVAHSHMRRGNVLRVHGDFKGADEAFNSVIAIRQRLAPASIELGNAYTSLGASALQRGEDKVAEGLFRRAMALREPHAAQGVDLGATTGNLGLIAKNLGDLSAAEGLFRKQLELYERVDPTSADVVYPLNYLGNLMQMKGEPAIAEGYFRRALAIAEKQRPGSIAVAGLLNNLGINAHLQGDYEAAADFQNRALALREKLSPDSLDVAASLNTLGMLARRRGELTEAEPLLRRGLTIKLKNSPGTLICSTSYFELGELALAKGDLPMALENHQASLAIRSSLAPGAGYEAESLYAVGKVLRRQGDLKGTATRWAAAIDVIEAQRGRLKDSEDTRSGFASRYSELYRDQIDLLVELGRPADAFDLLERSRAHGFLAMLAQRQVGFGSQLSPELAAQQSQLDKDYDKAQAALGKLNPVKDAADILKRKMALTDLSEQRGKLAASIREAAPHVAALSQQQSSQLAAVQQSLDPGTVLLSYSVGTVRTLLFVVTATGPLTVFALPFDAVALKARVIAFRGLIERGRSLPEPEAALLTQGAKLFDDLLGPALAIVSANERLVVSADGPLHVLPFAALVHTRAPLNWLADWRPLHFVISATVYAELHKRRRAPTATSTLVAFGDPAQGMPLPASRDEVTQLAALFGKEATTWLGSAATEAQALSVGTQARYLHFATHGVFDRRLPLDSGLVLTASGSDNGLLQAWEIIEKMRIDADLVTLSGCETGLGRELGGEGLVGLSRAFQYAGARSVVMSLWGVSDKSTAELMKAFYAKLKAGQSKDVALASAQQSLIHSSPWQQPFHWAAFELTGDWQ